MNERSRTTLLALSLAFNILFLGAAIGAASMWYWRSEPSSEAGQRGLWLAAKRLSAEQRQTFRTMLIQARRDVRDETTRRRRSREELARLLAQEKLDMAAIHAELNKIRDADAALRARLEQAVVKFAESLSAADRQVLLEGLRERRGSLLRWLGQLRN